MTARNKNLLISNMDTSTTPLSKETSAMLVQANNKVNLTINLRKIPLLSKLTSDEMNQIKKILCVRRFARREVIIKYGSQAENLLFLLSGRLQAIDLTEEGRVIGLNFLSAGDYFGETALINKSSYITSVIALSEVWVAFLPGHMALHIFSHSPSVAYQIQHHLARKVQRDYKFRALLSINNTSKRIYCFLTFLKQKNSQRQELVENFPTHQEIANMINTSRETVTRTLLMLVQQGIIRKDSRRLIIINPNALKKLAQNP